MKAKFTLLATIISISTACGGGGGNGDTDRPETLARGDLDLTVTSEVTSGPLEQTIEGETVYLSATITGDEMFIPYDASLDWGDGSIEIVEVTDMDGSGTVNYSHTYPEPGIYTATVSVTDDDGGVHADSITVIVDEAAVCDIDRNGDIDQLDVDLILDARGSMVTGYDPLDVDGDGLVTISDARACVLNCTHTNCTL